MKYLIMILTACLLLSGCATSKVKSAGRKYESVNEIEKVSYNDTYLYIQFSALDRTQKKEELPLRWARIPLARLWSDAVKTAKLSDLSYEPETISYQGNEYQIIKYHLNTEITEREDAGWELVLDESGIGDLSDSIEIQKESGSEIETSNPVFGSA